MISVFFGDKTDAQQRNKFHVHNNCYVKMRSICCHDDKTLASVSRSVIGDLSHIYNQKLLLYGYDTCCMCM